MRASTRENLYKIFICLKQAEERYLSLNMIAKAINKHPFSVSRLIERYFTPFIEEGHIANLKIRPIRLKDPTLTLEQFQSYLKIEEKIKS
jgi:hypothetical protein